MSRPVVTAEITFLTEDEGGKYCPPVFGTSSFYMPHVVIQSPDVRQAVDDDNRVISEPYQGVRFIEGPVGFQLGQTAAFKLDLMYYPRNRYADVVPGATYTVREGANIVAYGMILSRDDPDGIRQRRTRTRCGT